jgi:hypothetical protein
MIVRPANLESDHQDIIAGAKDFISRMDYTDFLPNEEKLIFVINRMLSIPGVEVTVAEHDGRIVGGVGMFYGPHIWNPDIISAEEIFLWAAKDAPRSAAFRLFRTVIKRIKERGGALATFKKLTSSPEGLESVYIRIGLRPTETSFMGFIYGN